MYTNLYPKIHITLCICTIIYMEQYPCHIIYVYLISPSLLNFSFMHPCGTIQAILSLPQRYHHILRKNEMSLNIAILLIVVTVGSWKCALACLDQQSNSQHNFWISGNINLLLVDLWFILNIQNLHDQKVEYTYKSKST